MNALSDAGTKQLVLAYSRISNVRGLVDLALHWGSIILVLYAVYYFQSILLAMVAFPLIAGLQNSLASLAHETFHCKAFTSRKLNSIVGSFLYSYPLGVPYQSYRKRHLEHHREVGYRSDPDWDNYQGPQFGSTARIYRFFISKLFGAYLFVNVFTLLGGEKPPILSEGQQEETTREVIYLALTQLALFALFALFLSWWMYVVLWLLPLVTLTSFLIGTRAYLEHNDPDEDSGVDVRLFDYSPGWLQHFFISPCHFHLHAVHHAFPAVPHYRLDAMKAQLAQRDIAYPGQDRPGYIQVFFSQARKRNTESRLESR